MSDQSPTANQFSPPIVSVLNFTLGVSEAEFVLTYGRSRVVFDTSKGDSSLAVEWLSSLSLSPAVAKMLMSVIKGGLEAYEKTYGKIPELTTGLAQKG